MNKLYEIDDLIAKVLTDEATTVEQTELNTWLAASPSNQQYFADLKQIWTQSGDAVEALNVDTDAAWSQVQKRIKKEPKKLTVSWLSTRNLLRIAAVGLVLFAATLFFNRGSTLEDKEIAAVAVVSKDSLSDGSRITLNKQSSLSTVFSKKERRVKMAGEAFFDVAHDTEKPFVIEVKTLEIKVVGTSFNVDNLSQAGKIVVVVETGKVLLRGTNGMEIYLEKGDKAVYDVATSTFEQSKNEDKEVMSYKNNLPFKGETLREAVKQINQIFDMQIEIGSPAIENCPLYTTYKRGDNDFIDATAETFGWTVERVGQRIILKGEGCN